MADRVVRCAPAVAGIVGVDVLGSIDEMPDGTGTSVDAAMGAGIGSAAGSRTRRAPRDLSEAFLIRFGVALADQGEDAGSVGLAKRRGAARVPTGDPD